MSEQTYVIKFESTSTAAANRYADELREAILDASSDVQVTLKKDDPSTMDFGGTLVILLGTPAVIAIAKGIGNWLKRRNTACITIEAPDGRVIARNISSKNAARLAEMFISEGTNGG